jgi:hypothetical protein
VLHAHAHVAVELSVLAIKDTTEIVLALNKFRPKRDHSQLNPDF